jgi:hypothetical protein
MIAYELFLKFCSWHIIMNFCAKIKKLKSDPNQTTEFIMKLLGSRCGILKDITDD